MIHFKKTRLDAITPFKKLKEDSGYDLTLLEKIKTIGNVEMYETGIIIKPPSGYYFDMVPRSSIIKSGYILANSVGVIDSLYRGSIKVPLIKIDKNKPNLELPIRLVQLIPRKIEHFEIKEVKELDDTERGNNGFGSSGKL
jgi:dUTP pyrophosphatase